MATYKIKLIIWKHILQELDGLIDYLLAVLVRELSGTIHILTKYDLIGALSS